MPLYSSSFDPRHYDDEKAYTVAFIEFIASHLLAEPILNDSGSLFDCMALHNIWAFFYPVFEKYADFYVKSGFMPLTLVIDIADRSAVPNFVGHVAQSYILGNIGNASNIESSDFCFNVIDNSDHEKARRNKFAYMLSQGDFRSLNGIKNATFHDSLVNLDKYFERYQAIHFSPIGLAGEGLDYYLKPVLDFTEEIRPAFPLIADEIKDGARALSLVDAPLRQSSATLINRARRYMPNCFDNIVVPLCRALRSQERAIFLSASIHINYELSSLHALIPDLYLPASSVLGRKARIDSVNTLTGNSIIPDVRFEGKPTPVFDWARFLNIIFTPKYQSALKAYKGSETESVSAHRLDECVEIVHKELAGLVQLELMFNENKRYLRIEMNHGHSQSSVYLVRLFRRFRNRVSAQGLSSSFYADYSDAGIMKEALRAILSVSGAI